jgi:membrane-bound lytic murein transglycosylase A
MGVCVFAGASVYPSSAAPSNTYESRVAKLISVAWSDLPGWQEDDLTAAWPAWKRSCEGLLKRNPSGLNWKPACAAAVKVNANNSESIRLYFQSYMKVMEVRHQIGAS